MRLDSVFAACSNPVISQPELFQIQDCLRCTRCPKSARVSSRFCLSAYVRGPVV